MINIKNLEKTLTNNENVGYIAGFLTTASFLPQVLKSFSIMKHNQGNGKKIITEISLNFMILICIGMILWIVYGARIYLQAVKKDPHTNSGISIILWNTISAFLAFLVIIFTIKS